MFYVSALVLVSRVFAMSPANSRFPSGMTTRKAKATVLCSAHFIHYALDENTLTSA
jgi:hypothetical protein